MTSVPAIERSSRRERAAPRQRARRQPSRSLAVGRLQRSAARQWLIALVAACTVMSAGVLYDAMGGVRPLTSALFWLPFALIAGLTLALVREIGRNTITSVSSLGKNRDYSILGAAPELTPRALRQLPPDRRTPIGALAFQPASAFATAFRDLQNAIGDARIVSVVSALPNDGATTTAACAAASATQQGRRAIVVDCDLRLRTLSRYLESDAEAGTLEAAERPYEWQAFVQEEPETGLHYIPAARDGNPWKGLADSRGFPMLIDELAKVYDLVVLDCPTLLGTADGLVAASGAERCVLVASWDRTPLSVLRRAMRSLKRANAETSIYVNRVPPAYRFGRLRGE